MTRSKFEMEALDANLWSEEEFGIPDAYEEVLSLPDPVDGWWYDEK